MSPVLFPLGDAAITIDYGNIIDETVNDQVLARFQELQRHPLPGMIEAIPAYSSLTILYDPYALKGEVKQGTIYELMAGRISEWLDQKSHIAGQTGRQIRIPVSYDGQDMLKVAEITGLSPADIISLHSSGIYRVYMLGFLPGFAYMGGLAPALHIPRKDQPELIKAGSVAVAGMQTGIYPLDSPGGWWVIGHTDMQLFNATQVEPCLLRPGDQVEFYSITRSAL